MYIEGNCDEFNSGHGDSRGFWQCLEKEMVINLVVVMVGGSGNVY